MPCLSKRSQKFGLWSFSWHIARTLKTIWHQFYLHYTDFNPTLQGLLYFPCYVPYTVHSFCLYLSPPLPSWLKLCAETYATNDTRAKYITILYQKITSAKKGYLFVCAWAIRLLASLGSCSACPQHILIYGNSRIAATYSIIHVSGQIVISKVWKKFLKQRT